MNVGNPPRSAKCPVCQASIKGLAGRCWKCGTLLNCHSIADEIVVAEMVHPSQDQWNVSSFSITTLLMITTLVAVCLAPGVAAPGLGIAMAIISLPPLIRTVMLVQHAKASGHRVSSSTRVGLYLGSLGVTMIVTWVTVSVSSLAFCFSCLASTVATQPLRSRTSEEIVLVIASMFALTVFGTLIWIFVKWIRARWKMDLERITRQE